MRLFELQIDEYIKVINFKLVKVLSLLEKSINIDGIVHFFETEDEARAMFEKMVKFWKDVDLSEKFTFKYGINGKNKKTIEMDYISEICVADYQLWINHESYDFPSEKDAAKIYDQIVKIWEEEKRKDW